MRGFWFPVFEANRRHALSLAAVQVIVDRSPPADRSVARTSLGRSCRHGAVSAADEATERRPPVMAGHRRRQPSCLRPSTDLLRRSRIDASYDAVAWI